MIDDVDDAIRRHDVRGGDGRVIDHHFAACDLDREFFAINGLGG